MSTDMALSITHIFHCNRWKILFLMVLCATAFLGHFSSLFMSLFSVGILLFIFVCGVMIVVGLFRKQFVKIASWFGCCVIAISLLCVACAYMPTATEIVAKRIAENMGVKPTLLKELWHCHGPDAVFVFRLDGEWSVNERFQQQTLIKWKKKIVATYAFYAAKCVPLLGLDANMPIYRCFRDGYVIHVIEVKDGYAIFYSGL